jgi:hypothetical protein
MTARRISLAAVFVVAVAAVLAVFMPSPSGAWPWDDDSPTNMVHVTGQVQCNGFDGSLEKRNPFQRVQGFEIRGRSNVLHNAADGYAATYSVDVPIGWNIEWSTKCSDDDKWTSGSFKVSKTTTGSSYQQTRHVCVGGSIYEPCWPREYGYCIDLWITDGWKFDVPKPEDAFDVLYRTRNNEPSDIEGCAKAIRDSLPHLNSQPAPQTASAAPTQPQATQRPLASATPVPTPGSDLDGTSTQGPQEGDNNSTPPQQGDTSTNPPSSPPPAAPAQRLVTISNQVTNGGSMREDPTPAYLSTVTHNRCRANGCMLAGTDMNSGSRLTVTCQTVGDRTTNGNDSDPADDGNPGRFESTRWYGARWSDGRFGFISEVWVADRGGLGLPTC